MVEVRHRHFLVALGTGIDDHGEGVEPRLTQHRHQQRPLVPADAVTIFEGECHVVRFEAGSLVFGDDSHVADTLRHESEERGDLLLAGLAFRKLAYFLVNCWRGLEVWLGEIPIPLREVFPGGEGGDDDPLQLRGFVGHIVFREGLWHAPGDPAVAGASIGERLSERSHRAGDFAEHGSFAKRERRRGDNRQSRVGRGPRETLERLEVRVRIRDARANGAPSQDHVEHLSAEKARDGEHEAFRRFVIDVCRGVAVRRGGADICLQVDRLRGAVGADDFRQLELRFREPLLIPDRDVAQLLGSLFRESLRPILNPHHVRAVRRILHITRLRDVQRLRVRGVLPLHGGCAL